MGERLEHRNVSARLVDLPSRGELTQAICSACAIEIQPTDREVHLECESGLGGADVGRHRRLVFAQHRIPFAERTRHRVEARAHPDAFIAVGTIEREAELAHRLKEGGLGLRALASESGRAHDQREQRRGCSMTHSSAVPSDCRSCSRGPGVSYRPGNAWGGPSFYCTLNASDAITSGSIRCTR